MTRAERFVAGPLCAVQAALLAWAAFVLPWRSGTSFAVLTALGAIVSAAAAIGLLSGRSRGKDAWRAASAMGLAYLGYLSWGLASSAVYVGTLNRGLGAGIGAALLGVWAIAAFLLLPLACWGLAATGGLPARRRALAIATGVVLLVVIATLLRRRGIAQAEPVPGVGTDDEVLAAVVAAMPRGPSEVHAHEPTQVLVTEPAACPGPVTAATVTVLAAFAKRGRGTIECAQGSAGEPLEAVVRRALERAGGARVLKLDVIRGVRAVSPMPFGIDALALRPGLDGACSGRRCLAPWQLVALDAFNQHKPLPSIPDARFGVSLERLRSWLGGGDEAGGELAAMETTSLLLGPRDGAEPRLLSRLAPRDVVVDAAALDRAARAAQEFIVAAQRSDGMFRYITDPFTGDGSFEGFSIARQAGTTLALCELGDGPARNAATRSVAMLADLGRRIGDFSVMVFPKDTRERNAKLTPAALTLSAMLTCRRWVGARHDGTIAQLARFVLAMQREDGGFHALYDMNARATIRGPGTLYEGGQAMLALSLLDAIGVPGAPDPGPAIDRAMRFFGESYWRHFAADFMWLEENWHCIAARAALAKRRNDAYERFCLDYVRFKSRLILAPDDGVPHDFVGGYGVGSFAPPHNTATAGFAEALAAALAVQEARGEDLAPGRALLARVLSFLLRQQWLDDRCFACSGKIRVPGGFGEHMASPRIRIDYVQHAWAGIGHGARVLGLPR